MYTTQGEVENYTLTTIDPSFTSQVEAWITAVTEYIDSYTDRTFIGVDATKKYDGNGKYIMYVDDLLELDTLTIDGVEITDYYLYHNEDANKTPKNKIVLDEDLFTSGRQNIEIEGTWGYSAAAPGDIKVVATKLVASIIKPGKDDGVQSFSEGDMSVTYKSFDSVLRSDISVKETLDRYKRPQSLTSVSISRV
ncbi:MAG: hypothetical protein AB9866_19035 [Syntrophobacteraceae bacterium]